MYIILSCLKNFFDTTGFDTEFSGKKSKLTFEFCLYMTLFFKCKTYSE